MHCGEERLAIQAREPVRREALTKRGKPPGELLVGGYLASTDAALVKLL